MIEKFTKIKIFVFIYVLTTFFNINSFADFVDSKNEFAIYGASKIYEERHPVDNGFFMSQEGWMAGLSMNTENYDSSDTYFSFQGKLGYGQVDYTSAGTGTMAGIPPMATTRFTPSVSLSMRPRSRPLRTALWTPSMPPGLSILGTPASTLP